MSLAVCSSGFSVFGVMSFSFIGAIPEFRCLVDGCANGTDIDWNNQSSTFDLKDSCYRYNLTVTDPILQCDPRNVSAIEPALLEKCDAWTYDTSTFESTVFTDFELACDNEWKVTLAGTLFMVGMFVGGLTLANIADVIGRRLALLISGFFTAVAMTASAFSPNFTTFVVLRFFCGVFSISDFLIIFVWGIEAAGTKHRILVGFFYQVMFSVGGGILGLIAFFIRDWRTLQLVVSVPMFTMVAICWYLPESTRWLITKKRYNEARTLILRAALVNKKHVPDHLLIHLDELAENNIVMDSKVSAVSSTSITRIVDEHIVGVDSNSAESIIDIIRSALLCRRLLVICLGWMTVTMCYYGLTFSLSNLAGNIYVNYQMMVFIEVPGLLFGMYLMDKGGRRLTVSGSMLLSGIACLAAGLSPADPGVYRTVLFLVGKLFISCCFAGIYSFTSELFPTTVRSAAMGLCSTCGRIGGIMAPIIADMGRNVDPALPFIIFSIICIIVAALCCFLPETNHLSLPSTIKEAEEQKWKLDLCGKCK